MDLGAGDGGVDEPGGLDEKLDAVCVVGPTGLIKIGSKTLHRMFGYKAGTLVGRNISILVPPPHSAQHNAYLHRYAQTGHAGIIGKRQAIFGLHRRGHLVRIALAVSVVDAHGEPSFMAVLSPLAEDEGSATLIVSTSSTIRAASLGAQALLGLDPAGLGGTQLSSLLAPAGAAVVLSTVRRFCMSQARPLPPSRCAPGPAWLVSAGRTHRLTLEAPPTMPAAGATHEP